MKVHINGDSRVLAISALTLEAFLQQEGYFSASDHGDGHRMVTALNGAVIPKQDYGITALSDGDKIDVLGVITGG